MKKFLSIILAVVMLVSLMPTAFAAEGDIVFNFADHFTANPGIIRHTEFTASPFEGLTLNTTGTGANAGARWETSGNTLRWNNTYVNWQTNSYTAGNANSNNKIAFDYNVPTSGWYRFSMPFTTNATAAAVVAVYDVFNNVPSFLGELKHDTSSHAVYLEAGTHTIVLCGVAGGATTDAFYIKSFNFTKVAQPTGEVALEGFPTSALGIGDEVAGLEAVVNTNYGIHQISGFGMKLSAANVKYRVETAGDTSNYLKVTYSTPGVVEVTVTPNKAVGAKGSVPYSITALGEGTTDVTFTPVVGGVDQTHLATTKSISVIDPNIVYDFAAFFTNNTDVQSKVVYDAEKQMPNFAVNRTGTALETYQKWLNTSIRLGNVNGDWYEASRSGTTGNNKVVWDITVPAGKAGWYTPSITFSANNANDIISLYNIANEKTTYVGDFKQNAGFKKANPVYLSEGKNTLVLAFTGGSNTTFFIKQLSFTKAEAPAAPASFNVTLPETIKLAASADVYSAEMLLEDGSTFYFPRRGVAANFTSTTVDTTSSYIKITSSNSGIVNVTETTSTTSASYNLAGVKEGTTDVTFTPVIDGVEKTELAVTKTISVVDENIVYDFVAWCASIGYGATDRHISLTPENSPEGFSSGNGGLIRGDAGYLRFEALSASWTETGEDAQEGSRFAMVVDVPAARAGWYTPEFKYHGNVGETGLCSVYHIYNGKVTYLGNTVNGINTLPPVYLSAGENTIAVGVVNDTTGMFVDKLAFYKYEGEVATLESISVADPVSTLAVGETSDTYEITTAMSDASSLKFPVYGINTETFYNTGRNYDTYIKITSTPANVVEVDARTYYEHQGGTPEKYYYTIKAVGEGDTVLSFIPVVNGVEMHDLKQTKTITVTHPNGQITGSNVSLALTAVVNGAISAEAKALLSESTIAAGEISSVAVGTEVTLKAASTATLKFLYWYNGNSGRMLSDLEEYTFTAGTNTPVFAKYADVNEVLIEYFSAAGQLIEEAEGTFKAEPDAKAGNYYKLYKDTTAGANFEAVTKTTDSEDFVCWKKDGKVVSYSKTYKYFPWTGNEEVVAATEGEKSSVPAVVLFSNGNAHMLELVNFEGVEIVEKGIVFGGGLSIDSCDEKAVSVEETKQFAATGSGEARAYVIYKDGVNYRVAYSD